LKGSTVVGKLCVSAFKEITKFCYLIKIRFVCAFCANCLHEVLLQSHIIFICRNNIVRIF
jgi:hypothetical protein